MNGSGQAHPIKITKFKTDVFSESNAIIANDRYYKYISLIYISSSLSHSFGIIDDDSAEDKCTRVHFFKE